MASHTPGIQQLLTAEKKASDKVGEARKAKAKRLKAAKEEAKVEIDSFRAQTEKKYKEREQEMLGSRDVDSSRMNAHQEEMIRTLQQQASQHKEVVIQRILELVCDVKPELHINYKSEKASN